MTIGALAVRLGLREATPRAVLLREFPGASCLPPEAVEQFGGLLLQAASNDAPGETVRYEAARQTVASLLRQMPGCDLAAEGATEASPGLLSTGLGILGGVVFLGVIAWWLARRPHER